MRDLSLFALSLPDSEPERAPLPTLEALQRMTEAELLALVANATPPELLQLWDLGGIEDIDEPAIEDLPEGDSPPPLLSDDPPEPVYDWYFPLPVLIAICERLPDCTEPEHLPSATMVTERSDKVTVLAKRRGENQEDDTPDARANPLLGFSLWTAGDLTPRQLLEHHQRQVTRLRNGAPVAGRIEVADEPHDDEWSLDAELEAFRQRKQA